MPRYQPPKSYTELDIARFERALAQHGSYMHAARALGITKNVMAGAMWRAGKMRKAPPRPLADSKWRDGCKWIDGHPGHGDWEYCGKPAHEAGSAWCAEHRARVYQPYSFSRLKPIKDL